LSSLLASRIFKVLSLDPQADAIVAGDVVHPWRYISDMIDAANALLDGSGEAGGCAVGLIMRNRAPCVAALGAFIATDRCVVTLSPLFPDAMLADDIRALGLHALVAGHSDLERSGIMDAAKDAGVIVLELDDDPNTPLRKTLERSPIRKARSRPSIAIEMLSSGTTGTPKRIPLTYESLESALCGDDARAKSRDSIVRLQPRPALVWHPIVHISGAYFVIDALYSGRKIILLERFDPYAWADAVEREEVRLAHLNPTAMRMLLEANVDSKQLSSLRVILGGTAATPPELQLAFEDCFKIPILTTYGATEFAGAIASWNLEDHRQFGRSHLGASGRAHEGVELRIVDPLTGEELAVGEEGVLEVRTSQTQLGSTTWVRTTDLAIIDNEGFLWIKGRVDDAIVRGGFKVQPNKVQSALEEHPGVREAAVVGVPDERLGAVPVAVVTLHSEAKETSVNELLDFVREYLAPYEVPSALLIVDEIPRTPSMKVSRPAVRELFAK